MKAAKDARCRVKDLSCAEVAVGCKLGDGGEAGGCRDEEVGEHGAAGSGENVLDHALIRRHI